MSDFDEDLIMDSKTNSIAALLESWKPTMQFVPKTCAQHGVYVSRHLFASRWNGCPTCEQERIEQEKREEEAAQQAARNARWANRLNAADIPERFRDRTLDRFAVENDGQANALAFAREFADEFNSRRHSGRSALFLGSPGAGKTHLACGIALRAMEFGASALVTTVSKLDRRIREAKLSSGAEKESEVIDLFVYPDLLVIDEVGVQSGSAAESRALFDVLNGRYESRKPTIILSNLQLTGVAAALGDRIFDRLREDGAEVIVFDWPSWRGRTPA